MNARLGRPGAYVVFCGNLDCETRRPGSLRTFTVSKLPDGKVWLCEECRTSDAPAWPVKDPCPCGMTYDHFHGPGGQENER